MRTPFGRARDRAARSGTSSRASRTGRGISSSRTRRTSCPRRSTTLEPEVRDWEPREALVGVGATEAVARGARRRARAGRRARPRGCSRGRRAGRGDARRARVRRVVVTTQTSPGATGSSRERGRDELGRRRRCARSTPARLVVIPTDTVYGLACRPDARRRPRAVGAQAALARAADRARRRERRGARVELIPELPARRPARPVHARRAESRAAIPVAGGRAAGHDRRARSRASPARQPTLLERVGVVAATSANLHGGAGSPSCRRRSRRDPRRRRGRARRRRAAGHALDGARPDRAGAARPARGRGARRPRLSRGRRARE